MNANEETTLGGGTAAVDPAMLIRNADKEPTLEGFDFGAFVAGVRPVRRAVAIYARGDLIAERDMLKARIREATDRGDAPATIDAMREQLADVVEQMTAPGAVIDVVVEARSRDHLERLDKALRDDGLTDEDEITLRIVAAQVVAPAGVTVDMLRTLAQVSQPQVNLIIAAATQANAYGPGMMPDFSPAGSAAVRRTASS